jgi:hypothetical protein
MPCGHAAGGGFTQFGGVPVMPCGHAAGGGFTQFGGVPIMPCGHAAGGGFTQFGGVPVMPSGHFAGTRSTLGLATQLGGVPVIPVGQAVGCVGVSPVGAPGVPVPAGLQAPGWPVVPVLHVQLGGVPVESDGQAVAPVPAQTKVVNDVLCGVWLGLLQRHWSPTIWPPLQVLATQTPFTTPLPDPQVQVPDARSTTPPSHGITLSTHLPGVPVCVRGSHGASGAQAGPLRPGAH